MSATDRTAADFEAAAVAHVHFRVRCETLGHGEEVYLVPDGGGMAKVGFSGYPLPRNAFVPASSVQVVPI